MIDLLILGLLVGYIVFDLSVRDDVFPKRRSRRKPKGVPPAKIVEEPLGDTPAARLSAIGRIMIRDGCSRREAEAKLNE